jgi:hypothetical protein
MSDKYAEKYGVNSSPTDLNAVDLIRAQAEAMRIEMRP